MSYPKLVDATLESVENVAILKLNRDDVRNVLTGTHLIEDIENTVDWANAIGDVSALIITGSENAFSAGGNLKEMSGRNTTHKDGPYSGTLPEVRHKYESGIQRIPRALARLRIPSIAAINGPAIGAGFDLALMCDMRLAARSAKLGETFLGLGLISGVGGAYWLTHAVGPQVAAELTLTAKIFNGEEAAQRGIVLEAVDDDELMQKTVALASQFASKPPMAVRFAKKLLKQAQYSSLEQHLQLCAELQGNCHNQNDHLEAVNAFLEKRIPHFTGS